MRPSPTLLLVFVFALALRVIYLWEIHDSPITELLLIDSETYDRLARLILSGEYPGEEVYAVNVNQFDIEVVPEGTLLVTEHNDKPGVISAISTLLGESNINISRMQVGVPDSNDKAMAVISISSPVSDELLEKVRAFDFVNSAIQINL